MSNLTIAYNGSTIFDGELEGEVTLPTDGMYMEDDVTVVWAGGGTGVSSVLNDNEWSVISEVAQAGEGGSYWAVGDTKAVALSGTVGTLSLDTTLWVYIIGINHRDVTGITFQGFKTGQSDGTNLCLVDSSYGAYKTDGTKIFNLSHWGNTSRGGWSGCDARYDILGSTDVAPSDYGTTAPTGRQGYNATATTATNPVSNTLMSCLPSDLRAAMLPMTIYTNNLGGSNATVSKLTATVDYLPLLAEYEVLGSISNAKDFEANEQSQYAYYSSGNSTIKYMQSSTGTTAVWWLRSPYSSNGVSYCNVTASGASGNAGSRVSYGLAPVFMV